MANIVVLIKEDATETNGGSGRYLWTQSNGSGAVSNSPDSAQKKSGLLSRKFAKTDANPGYTLVYRTGVMADAGRRTSFWFRYTGSLGNAICIWRTASVTVGNETANSYGLELHVTSGGALYLTNGGGGSGGGQSTTTLSADTWYRITVSYTITSSSVNDAKVYIDGSEQTACRRTNSTTNTGKTNLLMGITGSINATSTIWIDSVYVDDGTDLGDPGNILITGKCPASDTTIGWDTFPNGDPGVGSRYTIMRERPIDTSVVGNCIVQASSTQANCVFALESASQGDVDISGKTQVGYVGWVFTQRGSGSAGSPAIITNNVFDSTTVSTTTPSTVNWGVSVTSATYPSHSNGIGMRSSGAGSDTYLHECGILIAYIEPTGPAADFLPRRGSFGQDARLRR
jgi:hypothetical protein